MNQSTEGTSFKEFLCPRCSAKGSLAEYQNSRIYRDTGRVFLEKERPDRPARWSVQYGEIKISHAEERPMLCCDQCDFESDESIFYDIEHDERIAHDFDPSSSGRINPQHALDRLFPGEPGSARRIRQHNRTRRARAAIQELNSDSPQESQA